MNSTPEISESSAPLQKASLNAPLIYGKQGLLVCTLYTASGNHHHPLVIFSHGFPGHEKNLDLVQALRSAGFHVLQFSYAGSWGSAGDFSFSGCFEDADAAMNFVMNDTKYGFDKSQIFLTGHSFGCTVAAHMLKKYSFIKGSVFLMPCDLGAICLAGRKSPVMRREMLRNIEEGIPFLHGTSVQQLGDELDQSPEAFSMLHYVKELSSRKILWVSGKNDYITPEDVNTLPFMRALKAYPETNIRWRSFPSDHYLSEYREQISLEVVQFLSKCLEHSKTTINYATFQEELMELIHEKYQTLTLQETADSFNLSIPHTSALIKEKTGSNFTKLILSEKMKAAKELLSETNLSVINIAEHLGYDNPSYFMRVFKKCTGFTPSGYREQAAK